jgi:hypothetical protein
MEQALGAVIGCWMLDVFFLRLRVLAFENYFKADASDHCRCELKSPCRARLEVAGGFCRGHGGCGVDEIFLLEFKLQLVGRFFAGLGQAEA